MLKPENKNNLFKRIRTLSMKTEEPPLYPTPPNNLISSFFNYGIIFNLDQLLYVKFQNKYTQIIFEKLKEKQT